MNVEGKRVEITRRMRARGTRVGTERQKFHDERGTPNAYGLKQDADHWLKISIQGALSELIVAYEVGAEDRWVECVENYQELKGDVVDHLQVRSTSNSGNGLILHPKDKDNDLFVLVYVHHSLEWAVLRGWLWAHQGKQERFWPGKHADRPCFTVPPHLLKPWPAPIWHGEIVKPRPVELQAERKRKRTQCAQRKPNDEFRLICPRCAWAAKHLVIPYYDSKWSVLGGICSECCYEAGKAHDSKGWPEANPADKPIAEHELEDAIKTIFEFPNYKSKKKKAEPEVEDDSQTSLGL